MDLEGSRFCWKTHARREKRTENANLGSQVLRMLRRSMGSPGEGSSYNHQALGTKMQRRARVKGLIRQGRGIGTVYTTQGEIATMVSGGSVPSKKKRTTYVFLLKKEAF